MRVVLRFGSADTEVDVPAEAIPEDDVAWIRQPDCYSIMPWRDTGETTADGARILEYAL